MSLAPIAVFVYNRPEHTRRMVEALQKNKLAQESELFIFSDGPKNDNATEMVDRVRAYIKTVRGFQRITIVEREKNYGLSASVHSGVTEVVEQYGKIIVLEDDLVVAPDFLKYMNAALDTYEHKNQVMQISGFMFQGVEIKGDHALFLPCITSWGWATWSRAWKHMNIDAGRVLKAIEQSRMKKNRFNLNGYYDYAGLLQATLSGKMDSWAIIWYAAVFEAHGLVLYPPETLVLNMGFDGSGVHNVRTRSVAVDINKEHSFLFPENVEESDRSRHVYKAIGRMMRLSLCRLWINRFKIFFL